MTSTVLLSGAAWVSPAFPRLDSGLAEASASQSLSFLIQASVQIFMGALLPEHPFPVVWG